MQITNGEFFVCSSFILLPYYATIYAKRKKTETPFQGQNTQEWTILRHQWSPITKAAKNILLDKCVIDVLACVKRASKRL